MSIKNDDTDSSVGLLSERYARALAMRREGFTYKKIGIELGVSRARASQMVQQAEQKLEKQNNYGDFKYLSVRARNCLLGAGYKTKEQVFQAVINGEIHTGSNSIQNYGKRSHLEVCEWLGIKTINKKQAPNEETINKYISYLERHGYKITKIRQ